MRPAALAIAMLVLACERPAPPPTSGASVASPSAPALVELAGVDLRCQPAAGGVGVTLDGACVPIALRPSLPDGAEGPLVDAVAAAAAAHAVGQDCWAESNAAIGAGATFIDVTCGTAHGAVPAAIVRVGDDGTVVRVAIPPSGGARLTVVAGARPLLVAVLDDVGTIAFDARTLAGLAGWKRMGGWFNATTAGATAAPDGAWFAVPDPYGLRLDVVRVADLTMVGSVALRDARSDQGPGLITWTPDGLAVTTFMLPYE